MSNSSELMSKEFSVPEVASVAFSITGIGLDFGSISEHLRINATHCHRIGDKDMIGKTYPEDMWQLESPLSGSRPLEMHLCWLRDQIMPHKSFLTSLDKVDLSVYCGINSDEDQCGFHLSPGALKWIVELGIKLDVTVLF